MLLLWHRSVCLNIQNIKIHSCNCRQKYSPLCLGFGNEHISRWGLVSKDEWWLLVYFQPDGVILQWKQFCLKYYIVGCIMQLECRTFWSKVERIKHNHIRRLAGFRRSLSPKISNNPIYTLCLRKKTCNNLNNKCPITTTFDTLSSPDYASSKDGFITHHFYLVQLCLRKKHVTTFTAITWTISVRL